MKLGNSKPDIPIRIFYKMEDIKFIFKNYDKLSGNSKFNIYITMGMILYLIQTYDCVIYLRTVIVFLIAICYLTYKIAYGDIVEYYERRDIVNRKLMKRFFARTRHNIDLDF